MDGFFEKELTTTEKIDIIEKTVYTQLKALGFRKFGRTLHRFVSDDISQVINFQTGMAAGINQGQFCVNIGIRIPECSKREFNSYTETKKYYPEHTCTIRSRLGTVSGQQEIWYDLSESTEKIANSILSEMKNVVLPVFDILNSREAILLHRRNYSRFDCFFNTILLDECMIYGHLGNIAKAKELFDLYYQSAVNEYNDIMTNGRKIYLRKGEQVIYGKQHIIADKDGYVTLYGASHSHIDYLDELAVKLGLR